MSTVKRESIKSLVILYAQMKGISKDSEITEQLFVDLVVDILSVAREMKCNPQEIARKADELKS